MSEQLLPDAVAMESTEVAEKIITQESSTAAWKSSEAMKMVEARQLAGESKYAIITDIDNTFTRTWDEGQNPDQINYSQEIYQKSLEAQVPIIYITGNDVNRVIERIQSGELPPAQVIMGAVGTEAAILRLGSDGSITYVHDEQFDALLAKEPYNRRQLSAQGAELISRLRAKEHGNPQTEQSQLVFQNPEGESALAAGEPNDLQPYKLSFHFYANSVAQRQQFEDQMHQEFPDQKILICEEIRHNNGMAPGDTYKKYCFDLVAITKAGAADYAIDKLGLEGGVLAGDSGNDDHLYKDINPGFVRLLVGDAREEGKANIDAMSINRKTGQLMTESEKNAVAFRTLIIEGAGSHVLGYKEPGQNTGQHQRIGPQSLLHGLEVLQRWERRRRRLNQPEYIKHVN
jgi:hydroxymethylpyrimidine pyrophosphatase-like HAD family hydrolase